jgi:ABC-type multidrug transport system fused ATPase/permease subunit
VKFTRLLQYITPHRSTLVLIVVVLLIDSLAALAQPWIAGRLTTAVLEFDNSDFSAIRLILLGWLGLILVKNTLTFLSRYLIGSTGVDMNARLRQRIYDHMQVMPLGYFHERKAGETLSLLTSDAQAISNFITSTLVSLLPLALTFVGAFYIMIRIDTQVAMIAALLLPAYFIAMKLIGRKIRPIARDWIESWSQLISFVQENLGLVPVIKSFSRERLEAQRFGERNTTLATLSKRQILAQSVLTPAIGVLAGAGLLLLLWIGINHMAQGEITVAGLVSLLLYAMLMTRPVSGLANVYGQIQRARGAAERLLRFFNEKAEPLETTMPPLTGIPGRIHFEDVSFSYPGREPTLQYFDLLIEPGETIALTGQNGSGKTTLMHLLMRFADPTSGRICIDEQDISQHSLDSIRGAIGLVAQHTLLLNGSVAENIAYGQNEASEDQIRQAAKSAGAHTFITELPEGYDTLIGDQGVRLSGGQRQRISLARTLLKDPPILVLDEATAMLDPEGEADFIEHCQELLAERTVIIITHRLAGLALADRVIEMRQPNNASSLSQGSE